MMKHNTKYILFASVMSLLAAAGCQREDLSVNSSSGDDVLNFSVGFGGNGEIALFKSTTLTSEDGTASIPLSCTVTDGIEVDLPEAAGLTKSTQINSEAEFLGAELTGFTAAGWNSDKTEFIPDPTIVSYVDGLWQTASTYRWRGSDDKVFLAYANLPTSGAAVLNSADPVKQTFTYTVPTDARQQNDIMLGWYEGYGGGTATAAITMVHPLTAVVFKKGEMEGVTAIKSISIVGVYTSGQTDVTYALSGGNVVPTYDWGTSRTGSQTVTLEPAEGATALEIADNGKIGTSFIILPQTVAEGALMLKITVVRDGEDVGLAATIPAGTWEEGKTNVYTLGYTKPSPVHFVDLGLPSGILWADKNVGATSVTDMGDHYPWGETEEWYSSLSASYDYTMKPEYSGGFTVANYNSLSNMKSINANLTGAYEQYDVAAATYGDGCRMPSNTEFDELKANCYWRTVISYGGASVKGVVAFKILDSTHKGKINESYDSSYNYDMPHIFIPNNGYGQIEVLRSGTMGSGDKGANAGYYWLSDYTAHSFSFSSNRPSRLEDDSKRPRYLALGVRPVKKFVKSHEYVEIGGLKWATCNIGANSPKEYGWYFSWAGTTGYVRDGSKWVTAQGGSELSGGFSWGNTPYHEGNVETTDWKKYIPTGKVTYWGGEGSPDNILELVLDDDAARANWGGSWRMPTQADFQTLYEACGGTGANVGTPALPSANPGKGIYWVSNSQTYISDYNGVAGILFCDGTNKLFFPAAGYGDNTNLAGGGTEGRYWSGTVLSNPPSYAYRLGFQNGNVSPQNANGRNQGYPVRPVSD